MPTVTLDVTEYRSPDNLPPVCVVCGQDAHDFPEERFTLRTAWLQDYVMLAGICIFLWLGLASRQRQICVAHLPLCEEHLGYWWTRNFINRLLIGMALGSAILGLTHFVLLEIIAPIPARWHFSALTAASILWFVSLIVWTVYTSHGVHATSIRAQSITLIRIHNTFFVKLRALRAESGRDLRTGASLREHDNTSNP
jgi:hypothetical protein